MEPIFIIGAGRSGTNMLRDIITQLPDTTTWDCDEINPIWRHGNVQSKTDELGINDLTPSIKQFLRNEFLRISKKNRASKVVEKTCANSLRVPFVFNAFPEGRYILIYRDGRDVAASAEKRWTARINIRYAFKKLKYVPISDLIYYITKYGWNRFSRIITGESALSFWGPIYEGMKDDLGRMSLIEVCGRQWQECINSSTAAFDRIPAQQKRIIQYEDFVKNPKDRTIELVEFLKIKASLEDIEKAIVNVTTKSIGNYKRDLDEKSLQLLLKQVEGTLKKFSYV